MKSYFWQRSDLQLLVRYKRLAQILKSWFLLVLLSHKDLKSGFTHFCSSWRTMKTWIVDLTILFIWKAKKTLKIDLKFLTTLDHIEKSWKLEKLILPLLFILKSHENLKNLSFNFCSFWRLIQTWKSDLTIFVHLGKSWNLKSWSNHFVHHGEALKLEKSS